jgi:hypothetical protein
MQLKEGDVRVQEGLVVDAGQVVVRGIKEGDVGTVDKRGSGQEVELIVTQVDVYPENLPKGSRLQTRDEVVTQVDSLQKLQTGKHVGRED